MVIVLGLYFGVVWLVFSKLKLLPWNGLWKGIVYAGGLVIALTVIGLLNHTTPSGPVSVQGAVINIAPNVAGTVTEVSVEPNQPVARGDILFRIDDTTQKAEVARLEASLVAAQSAADQRLRDLQAARAEIDGLQAQLRFGILRRDDIVRLQERGVSTEFQMQEAVSTIEQLQASLRAAEARRSGLERRIAAQIDGVDVNVVEVQQALVQAKWVLEQTVVRAPADGFVTGLTLRPGNRATTIQGSINIVVPDDRVLVARLPQSSFTNVSVGDPVRIGLGTLPGQEFTAPILRMPPGTREGALDARSGLPSLRDLTGVSEYVVVMDVPDDMPAEAARLGVSGTALLITGEAGAISALAEVLFWVNKMLNYL